MKIWLIYLVFVLAILGSTLAIALSLAFPVFRFPYPTGPYEIGTLTYHWVDESRAEIFTAVPNDRRELMVQIWYPAKAGSAPPKMPYLQNGDIVMASFAKILQKPEFIFRNFKYVTTNASTSAGMADAEPSYPLLLFLEGAAGFRQMNTFQVEELVSQGYVVAAIDQPGTAAAVVFPDGHHISGLSIKHMQALIRPSYMAGQAKAVLNGKELAEASIIPYLTQDAIFVLNQLAELNRFGPNQILAGRLDMQRVGAFGVSLGGIVVAELCRVESRLRACLLMDAPMPNDVVQLGLARPSMWMTRDADTMRLERVRSGGWPENEISSHLISMRAAYVGNKADSYFMQLPGAFHSNFTDVPLWSPLAQWLGITGPMDGARAHQIINTYSLAFFNKHLKNLPATQLETPSTRYPEILLEEH